MKHPHQLTHTDWQAVVSVGLFVLYLVELLVPHLSHLAIPLALLVNLLWVWK